MLSANKLIPENYYSTFQFIDLWLRSGKRRDAILFEGIHRYSQCACDRDQSIIAVSHMGCFVLNTFVTTDTTDGIRMTNHLDQSCAL